MKTSVIFLASMMMAAVAFGQNNDPVEYTNVEIIAPRFQGEIFKSANDFLTNSVQYPVESKNRGLEGTEIVEFMVTLDGTIKDFKVVNSISSEIDNEVIRVLQATNGQWKPGIANGEPVEMKKEISVTFILTSEERMIEKAVEYQVKGCEYLYTKNNPKKALKYFEKGIVLLPNEESLLAACGLCKYELGDHTGALAYWTRLKKIDENNTNKMKQFTEVYSQFKGYEAMIETIKE